MKFEFPDTGEGVTEGKFLEWKIEEGDQVEEDQVLAEAETDKAVVEIPAPADGRIKSLMASPGDIVEVGDVILEIDTEGSGSQEPEEKSESMNEEPEIDETGSTQDRETETSKVEKSSGQVLAMPRVRKYARENGIDLEEIGVSGRITMEDVQGLGGTDHQEPEPDSQNDASDREPARINASPSVRRFARDEGVDISQIEGSGRGGKVLREDVVQVSGTTDRSSTVQRGEDEVVELSNIRKQIASKMSESRFSAPHVTHVDTADMTQLVEKRSELNESIDAHLTYTPFIIKAAQIALEDFPDLNAHFNAESSEVVRKSDYDINIAVDTDAGLMVPLLENAGQKNLLEIAREEAELVDKAQSRDISPDELKPGSFSITNIGVIGGEAFTPIINPPQTGILGIGKIQKTPEVVDGEVVPRDTITLSLSYDHRVIDGATGARFVNRIIELLETPEKMLIEMY